MSRSSLNIAKATSTRTSKLFSARDLVEQPLSLQTNCWTYFAPPNLCYSMCLPTLSSNPRPNFMPTFTSSRPVLCTQFTPRVKSSKLKSNMPCGKRGVTSLQTSFKLQFSPIGRVAFWTGDVVPFAKRATPMLCKFTILTALLRRPWHLSDSCGGLQPRRRMYEGFPGDTAEWAK